MAQAVKKALKTASAKLANENANLSELFKQLRKRPISSPEDARNLADVLFGKLCASDRRILGVHGDHVFAKFSDFRSKLESAKTNKVVRIFSRCNSAIEDKGPTGAFVKDLEKSLDSTVIVIDIFSVHHPHLDEDFDTTMVTHSVCILLLCFWLVLVNQIIVDVNLTVTYTAVWGTYTQAVLTRLARLTAADRSDQVLDIDDVRLLPHPGSVRHAALLDDGVPGSTEVLSAVFCAEKMAALRRAYATFFDMDNEPALSGFLKRLGLKLPAGRTAHAWATRPVPRRAGGGGGGSGASSNGKLPAAPIRVSKKTGRPGADNPNTYQITHEIPVGPGGHTFSNEELKTLDEVRISVATATELGCRALDLWGRDAPFNELVKFFDGGIEARLRWACRALLAAKAAEDGRGVKDKGAKRPVEWVFSSSLAYKHEDFVDSLRTKALQSGAEPVVAQSPVIDRLLDESFAVAGDACHSAIFGNIGNSLPAFQAVVEAVAVAPSRNGGGDFDNPFKFANDVDKARMNLLFAHARTAIFLQPRRRLRIDDNTAKIINTVKQVIGFKPATAHGFNHLGRLLKLHDMATGKGKGKGKGKGATTMLAEEKAAARAAGILLLRAAARLPPASFYVPAVFPVVKPESLVLGKKALAKFLTTHSINWRDDIFEKDDLAGLCLQYATLSRTNRGPRTEDAAAKRRRKLDDLRTAIGVTTAKKIDRYAAAVAKANDAARKAHTTLMARRRVANKANVAKALSVFRTAQARCARMKKQLSTVLGEPTSMVSRGYRSVASDALANKIPMLGNVVHGEDNGPTSAPDITAITALGIDNALGKWKLQKRLRKAVDFGHTSFNISRANSNGEYVLESVSLGVYLPFSETAPKPPMPVPTKETEMKMIRQASMRETAKTAFEKKKAIDPGMKPGQARTTKADKKAAVSVRKKKAQQQRLRRACKAVGMTVEAKDAQLVSVVEAFVAVESELDPRSAIAALRGARVLLHHRGRNELPDLVKVAGLLEANLVKPKADDWRAAMAAIDIVLRDKEAKARVKIDEARRKEEVGRLDNITTSLNNRPNVNNKALKAAFELKRERNELLRRKRADYRPGPYKRRAKDSASDSETTREDTDSHVAAGVPSKPTRGRSDHTIGSCTAVDDDIARVLLDVAQQVAPGQALVGIDRNAEDIFLFAITHDGRPLQFVLTAHEAWNRIGGFNQKARSVAKRGQNLPRRGNAGHMKSGLTAAAVTAMRKRAANAIARRKRRKITEVVRLFIRSVVDYVTGRFTPNTAAANCTIFCGNANFKHNMPGGLTWIGADALLNACASVTTTYSVNEAFSSQKCAFCTHFVERPDGDYKRAHCPECNIELLRDLMAAACMLRIGLWWWVHGEREDAFTVKRTASKTEPVAEGKTTASTGTPTTRKEKRPRAAGEQDANGPVRSTRRRPKETATKRKRADSPIPGLTRVTRWRTSAPSNAIARHPALSPTGRL